MNKKPRLSAMAPLPKKAEDFIEAADKPNSPLKSEKMAQEKSQSSWPWEADTVREDVIKSINLRLSEPYILKLQFLSEQTNKSQQRIIREVLCPAIDQELEKLLAEQQ